MRRILHWLFPICAASILFAGTKVNAEPPFLPFATCNEGKCVVAEKDLNELKAFHLRLMQAASSIQEQNGDLMDALETMRRELNRRAYCQAKT